MGIITATQATELDYKAIHDHGMTGIELMGNAGKAVADEIKKMTAEIHEPRIAIICGKGNNGGDGFAIAPHLNGFNIQLYTMANPSEIKGDAAHYLSICQKNGLMVDYQEDPPENTDFDLVVDAILGTGCKGELRSKIIEWTQWINSCNCKILAVDSPTGVDGNTGSVATHSVNADITITMGYPKLGLYLKQGKVHSGEVKTVDIGFPEIVNELNGIHWRSFSPQKNSNKIKKIRTDTYKHKQGKVLLICGSKGMTGAAILSTFGALRSGAGLTVTCAPNSIEDIYEKTIIEGMTLGCEDKGKGSFGVESFVDIEEKLEWCDTIIIGPGIGSDQSTMDLVEKVLLAAQKPIVIDADALRVFHQNFDLFKQINAPFIITPHEGEFAMLLGVERDQFLEEYPNNIETFMSDFPGILVLKNAPTISFRSNNAILNPSGNPGMATAGMGDVLAGILGTLTAQGMDPFIASQIGVYIHGLAADRVAKLKGERGLIASDILDELPKVMNEFD